MNLLIYVSLFLAACNVLTEEPYLYTEVDVLPVLEYEDGFNAYIYSNLNWPNQFDGEGQVLVSFVVTRDGDTDKIKIERSLCPSCDEEVSRILTSLPKWKPGEKDGQVVDVKFYLPIEFRLQN